MFTSKIPCFVAHFRMNVPKFLDETELLVRTYEKEIFDKKIGDLCIESTENDTWLECNVDFNFYLQVQVQDTRFSVSTFFN